MNKLELDLKASNDKVYVEKKKRRDAIVELVEKSRQKESGLQNYIDGLQEENLEMAKGWEEAQRAKQAAEQTSSKAHTLAEQRLRKWHNERAHCRKLQDELVK